MIGYARISKTDQNLELQIEALKRAGVRDDDLYVEMKSAVSTRRPQLALALKALHPGDTFVIWKIDRLGRSVIDLMNYLEKFDAVGVTFRSLTELIDTKTPQGRFAYQLAAAFAEMERNMIRERTAAGMAILKARGVKLGAELKMTAEKMAEARALLLKPNWTIPKVAKKLKVSPSLLFQRFPGGQRALVAAVEKAKPARKRKVKR